MYYDDVPTVTQQFDLRHSKEGPGVLINRRIIYPDGAWRDSHPLGVLVEPPGTLPGVCAAAYPRGPGYERWSTILLYREWHLKKAIEEFDAAKRLAVAVAKNALGLPVPGNGYTGTFLPNEADKPDERLAAVRALHGKVKTWQRLVDNAKRMRDEADPRVPKQAPMTPAQQEASTAYDAAREAARSRYLADLEALEI